MDFEQFVLANEPTIRLGFFLGIFALVGLWELAAPRRALTVSKALRWASNLGLVVLNTVLLRLLFPAGGSRSGGLQRAKRLGPAQPLRGAVLGGGAAGGDRHGLRHLAAARHGPRRAGAVAAAPGAPRRPRLRRDHRRALPPARDRAVDADQVRHHHRARPAGGRRGDLRGAAQCHRDVQPRQHPPACRRRPGAALVAW